MMAIGFVALGFIHTHNAAYLFGRKEKQDVGSNAEKSKKAQRKHNKRQRNCWPISPVTQIVPNKKAYCRRREKRNLRMERGVF